MSRIASLSTVGYELCHDATHPGGLALKKIKANDAQDTVCLSQAGREISAQVVALRDEAAQQVGAAARYQAARAFGQDFSAYIESNITVVGEFGKQNRAALDRAFNSMHSQAFTTVSAEGTVIGISRIVAEDERLRPDLILEVFTAQITRKDGLQINITLDDDVRINDLEDGGLSIYYASSGVTKVFDAEGRESVSQGERNVLGTEGNDIIINRRSLRVDAGNGDDLIINLANNAEILGGDGNDSIFLPMVESKGLRIDGGAGDDRVVGARLHGSKITMEDGNDTLIAADIQNSNITSSGSDRIKSWRFIGTSLVSKNGNLNFEVSNLLDSNVKAEKIQKNISINNIRGAKVHIESGDISLSTRYIADSKLFFGYGNVNINALGVIDSEIYHSSGGTDISVAHIHRSDLNLKKGNSRVSSGTIVSSTIGFGDCSNAEEYNAHSVNKFSAGHVDRSLIGITGNDIDVAVRGAIIDSAITAKGEKSAIKMDSALKSNIVTGNGDNDITIRSLDHSVLMTGDGNDNIKIEMSSASRINTGGGNDFVSIKYIRNQSFASDEKEDNIINTYHVKENVPIDENPIIGNGSAMKNDDNESHIGGYGPRFQLGRPDLVEKKSAPDISKANLSSFIKSMQKATIAALYQSTKTKDDVLQSIRERLHLWA